MSTTTIHYETAVGFTPLTALGPYRAADYETLPEGEPVELIRGRLVVSPAPFTLHQTVSAYLTGYLLDIARKAKGWMFAAPTDVVLADHTIVQPDLLYVRRERRHIIQNRVEGPPDLVIEIVSEGGSRRDRVEKLDIYAEFGVAEYWIVEPEERHIEFLINRNGNFEIQRARDNRYASPICEELAIDLAAFWSEIEDQIKDLN